MKKIERKQTHTKRGSVNEQGGEVNSVRSVCVGVRGEKENKKNTNNRKRCESSTTTTT